MAPGGHRTEGRRGMVTVGVLLVVLAVVVDLLRADSAILGFWQSMTGSPGTPLERMLDDILP